MRLWFAPVLLAGTALAQSNYLDLLNRSHSLQLADVQRLETALVSNPDDIEGRSLLIGWYFQQARLPEMRKHVIETIRRHPEAPVLGWPMAGMRRSGPTGDEADYLRAAELWRAQRTATDSAVLAHAALFFAEGGEPETAADLLERDVALHPEDIEAAYRLGRHYGRVALATVRDPARRANDPYYSPAFAERIRTTLETTNDLRVLRASGAVIESALPGLNPLPPEWSAAAARVAAAQMPADRNPPVSTPQAGLLPETRIVRKVEPEYPALARQARIQAMVRLMVKVAPDGSLAAVTVLSGHPLLIPAALTAVKQWTFAPGAETTGAVEIPFSLGPP